MVKLIYEDINDKYASVNHGDFQMIIMKENGYINATKICNEYKTKNDRKKEFRYWKENSATNELLKEFSKYLQIPIDDLMIVITGGKITNIRGTYVHPLLVTSIAHWISPQFAVKVSLWVEEWKAYSEENNLEYYKALSTLVTYQNNCKERKIQKKLQKKLGGEVEVKTKVGKIDLLTDDLLIEIKEYDNWKCALGQLIAYSIFHPEKEKCMYLFDVRDKDTKYIRKICKSQNIDLKIYD